MTSLDVAGNGKPPRRPRRVGPITSALIAIFTTGVASPPVSTQPVPEGGDAAMHHLVPGDSRRGSVIFRDRGCAGCHRSSFGSTDERIPIPSLGSGPLTAVEIAARLWNHGPSMWDRMRSSSRSIEPLSSEDMADLFAFFFYLGVVDQQGDPEVGELLFRYKRCATCHEPEMTATGSRVRAPAVRYWSAHTEPLRLISAMWNHARGMAEELRERGGPWPDLSGEEIGHIVAYVRRSNPIAETRGFRMGDPVQGAVVFLDKGCAGCHPPVGDDRHRGPGIDAIGRETSTIAGMAGRMWSHYPDMVAGLDDEGVRRLNMTEHEIGDVVAYLFAVGYFDAEGHRARGGRVFEAKGCAGCHARKHGADTGLDSLLSQTTPADFARSMWNHGPRMAETMRSSGVEWPRLTSQDVADLIAYFSED